MSSALSLLSDVRDVVMMSLMIWIVGGAIVLLAMMLVVVVIARGMDKPAATGMQPKSEASGKENSTTLALKAMFGGELGEKIAEAAKSQDGTSAAKQAGIVAAVMAAGIAAAIGVALAVGFS